MRFRRAVLLCGAGLLAMLASPPPAGAYVGPGAGFAVLSSFLALFLGFLYSLIALIVWPWRQLRNLRRRRTALGKALVKRVVVLGLDGVDPELITRYMEEGKLPNFARLRDTGAFFPLKTTLPPISPVAWSSFQTGVNPGKHNIFDFLGRDPGAYLPYLSSAQVRPPKRILRLGRYAIPLGPPQLKLLRKAKPFWHYLGEAGVFSSVIRVPITFPPERFSGVLLSGMCVPDLLGSQGTFSFHSSRADPAAMQRGGARFLMKFENGWFVSHIPGPPDHLRAGSPAELRIPFRVRPDAARGCAEIAVQQQRFTIRKGGYSEWIELQFRASLGASVHGICRFYLKELEPHLEIYITPVNIHPAKPALPVSHPFTYSVYLSKLLSPYATLGLAEDTWALNEGALDEDGYLQQCYLNHEERECMFFDALEKTARGVCVCVFDTPDRVQHMFWRFLSGDHPAARHAERPERYRGVIEQLYRRLDDLVRRTVEKAGEDSLVLILSDHGFQSFERGVNLNTWLYQNGYLALKDGAQQSGEWFRDVDWRRTRAYAMGLNGLYVNQAGREISGVVPPGRPAKELKDELRRRLCGLLDSARQRAAVRDVFDTRKEYLGPYRDNAPDLVVGFNEGYRASWDSVTGKVSAEIFEDNVKPWSGDHCIHPDLVPGILFSNHKLQCDCPSILDVAPTLLEIFGIPLPRHFDGKPWAVTPRRPHSA